MIDELKADLQLRKYLPFLEFLTAKDPARNIKYTQIASWIRQKEVRTEIDKDKCERAIKYRYDLVRRGKEYVLPKNVIEIFEPVLLEISDDSDCEILDVTPGNPPDSDINKNNSTDRLLPKKSTNSLKRKTLKTLKKIDKVLSDGELSLSSVSSSSSGSSSSDNDEVEMICTNNKEKSSDTQLTATKLLPNPTTASETVAISSLSTDKASSTSKTTLSNDIKSRKLNQQFELFSLSGDESSSNSIEDDKTEKLIRKIDEVLAYSSLSSSDEGEIFKESSNNSTKKSESKSSNANNDVSASNVTGTDLPNKSSNQTSAKAKVSTVSTAVNLDLSRTEGSTVVSVSEISCNGKSEEDKVLQFPRRRQGETSEECDSPDVEKDGTNQNTECKKIRKNPKIPSERNNCNEIENDSNELKLNHSVKCYGKVRQTHILSSTSKNNEKFENDNSKKEIVTKLRTEPAVGNVNRTTEATNETRTKPIVDQSIPIRSQKFDENCQNTVNFLRSQKNDCLLRETNDNVAKQSVERRPSFDIPSSNNPSELLQNKNKSTEPVASTESTNNNLELGTENCSKKNVQETNNLAFVKGKESNTHNDKHKSNQDKSKHKSDSSTFNKNIEGKQNDSGKNKDSKKQSEATSKDSKNTKQDTKPNNQTNKEFLFSRREKKPTEDQADDGQSQLFSRRNEEISRRSTDVDGEIASIPKTNAKPYNDKPIETVSLLSDEELEISKTQYSAEQNFQAKVPKESHLSTSSSSPTLPSKTKPGAENRTPQMNTVPKDLEMSTNSLTSEIENLELDQLNDLFSGFCEKNGVQRGEFEKMIARFLHSESDVEPNNFSNSIPKQNDFVNQKLNFSSEMNSNPLQEYQQQHQQFQQQSQHVSYENPQPQHQHIYRNLNNPLPQQTHPSNQNLLHTLIKRNDPRVKSFLKKIENSPIAPSDLRNFAAYTRQISNDPRVPQVPAATSSSTRPFGAQKCPKTYKEHRLQKEKAKADRLAAELKKIEAERLCLTIGKDASKVKTKTNQVLLESEKSSSVQESTSLNGKVPIKLSGIRRFVSSSSDDDHDFEQPSTSNVVAAAPKDTVLNGMEEKKENAIKKPRKKIGPKCRMKKRKIFVPVSSSSENENQNDDKLLQDIQKPASILDYLSTREIEKALDTVMPAIEDIVTSPLDLTVETGDHNNCSTGSLSPTGKAFSRCARELSNLQCTLNGAPNVISMLISSRKNKRQSSSAAQQKIGSQLTPASSNERNLTATAAPISRRRRTLVEKIKSANDVVNEIPEEIMIDKTTAKPVSRRRMTCDERIQLRFNHDHDVYSVKQVSQDNQIHQNCSTKHSEEGKNSSDTDQFDYEEYKLQKAKAKAMESKISIVVERLPESVVEEITKRNETGGQQEVVKNLAEDIQASSTNPTQTFAKKSTSFIRNAMNLPPSRISKNTLNTNRDMIYDSTSYCVLCKSKPRSGLTEHYVHRHQTESYVSRLSEEKLDEISSSMQIAELVPTASNARSRKYKVTCGFCNDEIIDTFTNFYAHYSTHTGEYAFRCDSCDLLKPFREDIISHQRHERECRRAKVRSQYLYRSDVTVIHLYACGFCNFVQLNEANTEKHIRDHHRHHYSLANNETNIRGVILAAIVDAQLTNERMDVDEQEEEDEEAYTSHFSGQQILHTDGQALDIKDIFPQFSNEDAEVEEKDSLSNDKVNVEMESSLETGAAERVDTSAPPIPMTVIHNTEPARAHEHVFPPVEQHSPLPDPTVDLTVKTEMLNAISSESASVVPPTEEDKSASSTSNYSISTENNNGTSSPYTALTKYREYSMPKPYFGLFKCMAIDCVFSTDDKDQMLQHLSDHRASERPPQGYLECSYCCSSQNEHLTPSALILHIQDRHALSRYQCSQCCYRSCLPGNVQIHRKLCHRDTNFSTSDNIVYLCAGRGTSVNEKIDHMRCEMSKNVKPLSCSEISCPTLYAISSMEEHLVNFHNFKNNVIAVIAKFQSWTCIYCGENVHTKQKMQEHLAINHPDEYAFACHRVLINNSGKVAEDNRIDNLHLVNVSTIVLPKNIRTAEGDEQIFSNSMRLSLVSGDKTSPTKKNIPASIGSFGSLNASKSLSVSDNEIEIIENNEIESRSMSQGSLVRSTSIEEISHELMANNDSEQVTCVTPTEIKVETEEDYISIEKADLRPLILKLTSGTGIAPDVLYRCPVKECSAFFSIFELWSKHVSLKHNLFMVDCPHCHHHKTELSLREFSSHFQSHCRHLYICFECATTSVSETECVIHYFENHENGVDLMSEKVNIGGNYSYTIIRKNFEMCHLEMLRHLNNTIRLKLQGIEAQEAAKEMIRWPHQRQEWEDDFPIFVDFGKQAKKCMVPLCPFTTDDNEILFRHVIAEHSVSGQSFTCSNCKFHLNACTDWKPVIDHLRKHLSDLFVCCTCGSSTSSRDVMTTHIKCSHNSRDVIVVNYFRSMGVQRFISIDIVLAEKVTTPTLRECFCCEKDVSGGKLTSHLNNEHNLRFRYFCEYCGEKLQNPGNVADHHATMHLDMDCRAFKLRCALMTTSRELRVTKVIPFTLDVPATKKHPLTNDDEGYTGKKIKLENDVIIDDEIVVLEETVDDLPVETPKITLKCVNISNLLDSNKFQTSTAVQNPAPQPIRTVPHITKQLSLNATNFNPVTTSPYVPMMQSGAASRMRIPAPSTSNSYTINPPVPPVTITIPNINCSYTFVPSTISPSSQQPSSSFPSPSQYYYAPQRQSAMFNTNIRQPQPQPQRQQQHHHQPQQQLRPSERVRQQNRVLRDIPRQGF